VRAVCVGRGGAACGGDFHLRFGFTPPFYEPSFVKRGFSCESGGRSVFEPSIQR
jgi:hypothetical protein